MDPGRVSSDLARNRIFQPLLKHLCLRSVGITGTRLLVGKLNGKDFDGWKMFLDPSSKISPQAIWKVEGGMYAACNQLDI